MVNENNSLNTALQINIIKQLSMILFNTNIKKMEDIDNIVSFITKNKEIVNYIFQNNNTFLHFVAKKYIPSIIIGSIEKFITYEALNLYNTRDHLGETPLMAATTSCNEIATITLLISQQRVLQALGYKDDKIRDEIKNTVNISNLAGLTPLHIAARYHDINMINYLLDLGASPLLQDVYGNTPAHLATYNKNTPQHLLTILYKFASQGVNPYTTNILGETIIDNAYKHNICYNSEVALLRNVKTSSSFWTIQNTYKILQAYQQFEVDKAESFVNKLDFERQKMNFQAISY